MRVFVILLVMIGFVGIVYAHEPKPFPEELDKPPIEIWNESRAILDGTITLKDQSEEWTNYDITINEMFKATTKAKSVTGFVPRNHDWILNEGDRALIYLKSGNEISLYSAKSTNNCTPRDLIQISPVLPNDNSIVRGAPILPWDWKDHCVPHYFTYDPDFWNYMEYKSPLRQYVDHNLPIHMQRCGNDEHVSVIPKSHPYHIACVTESTKLKLVERGWTTKDSGIKCDNNDDFDLIRYSGSDDIHPQRLVAFLKEGTTGFICLQYISNLDNDGFFGIDESLHQRDSSDEVSPNVVLNAIPNKVSREYGTDVTVAYEIHAKNNSTGTYWINLSQLCDSLPVVVWDEEPRVSGDDIPVATGIRHCPAKFLDVNIIGYSGLDLQYHSAKPT